jgi:hypothetical protein
MKVMAFMRNYGRVRRTERPSAISAIVYIIDQIGFANEPITLGLDGGEIVVQGYGKRPLGTVCSTGGLNFSYEDVLRAEGLLAKSLAA